MTDKETIVQLESELLAERQLREEAERKAEDLSISGMAACGSLMKENDKLKSKLLSAQVAIEKMNKQITVVSALSGDVAHQCDFHAIDASKWWKAVQKLQKMIVVKEDK